jgi:hypothetical protein
LGCFDRGGLVQVAFVVDIEFSKGILELEDFVLLELRILALKFEYSCHGSRGEAGLMPAKDDLKSVLVERARTEVG